ncbi:LysR family transcriptional regulator [Actinokineospora soli]|uniref:LysR family transcriptional regulator n=1 Tax=Actinokineospora soli TaxID=1048753 RepID=A0ABW2TQX1_9PSEU
MDLLRHLRYFVTVAEERHFGRAAERLHMAQPPLSQQIRRLEADLGVELFTRTTRRVDLTRAGTAYLTHARAILASVDTAADDARRAAAGVVGKLTIGCVGSATYSLLPTLARRLTDQMPDVHFSFRGDMLAADQVEALRDGAIDLALLRPPVNDHTLTLIPLRHERLIAAVPADHALATRKRLRITDLADTDLIIHSAGRRSAMYDTVLRLFTSAGTTPRIRHEVGETSTLLTLVAGGLGTAVVPHPVTTHPLDGVVYIPLRPTATIPLALAHRPTRPEPHLHRTVTTVIGLMQPPTAPRA